MSASNYEILVNKDNPLTKDFIPQNLVEIHAPMGTKVDPTYVNMLDSHVYSEFLEMQKAALKLGYVIYVDSSYRSYAYQEKVLHDLILKKGEEEAIRLCAMPGTSEHQTGLALDVIISRDGEMIEDFDENFPEIIWLLDHAHEFGFILRYPKGKEDITGYKFEPWHFRYVGRDLAITLHDDNITLEEYYLRQRNGGTMRLLK